MSIESNLRDHVEAENDYLLRIARIQEMRGLLDKLTAEAKWIKTIDFPLWYVKENRSYYGIHSYSGIESGSTVLVREDVSPEMLKWISDMCTGAWWYGEGYSLDDQSTWHKQHPLYRGFSQLVEIGNASSPTKRYYKGSLRMAAVDMKAALQKKLGPYTWSKLPLDAKGKTIYV